MKYEITVKCNKCGKVAPIDEEKTTDHCIVYKIKEPCKCGGQFVPCMLSDN